MKVIVVLHKDADRDAWISLLRALPVQYEDYEYLPRHFVIEYESMASFPLKDNPMVEIIEEDATRKVCSVEQTLDISGDFTGANWGLARLIRRSPPWPVGRLDFPVNTSYRSLRTGVGVDIYLFDSGIRLSHQEFGGKATNVYEYYSSGGVGDDYGHGTSTAGMAVGSTVGVAKDALIFSFKCVSSSGGNNATALVASVNSALSHYASRSGLNRPAVASISLVGHSATADAAIDNLIDAGIVVVAAAGNEFKDLATFDQRPAESDADVIVVGGIGPADIPFYSGWNGTGPIYGSCWGTRVDVSAAAQRVLSATFTNDTSYVSRIGTSLSTPLVAGAIGCILEGKPRLTNRAQVQAVRNHVRNTATTGHLVNPSDWPSNLPDRIMYLNPDISSEYIAGLD